MEALTARLERLETGHRARERILPPPPQHAVIHHNEDQYEGEGSDDLMTKLHFLGRQEDEKDELDME